MTQMRLDHFNPHGLRKGSATHAVSGTTLSPSLPSVARRGEWSQGLVLDVCWHFASIGDHYLGRILAGLQPNDAGFATLPPHFNIPDPMGNADVARAMGMMFHSVIANCEGQSNNPTPMLLRCLACVVYHADSMLEVMVNTPGHDFSKIPVFHDKPLLEKLQELVTTDPTEGTMAVPTGIPPHVELASQVQKVLDLTTKLLANMGEQTGSVIEAVHKAIEEKALESGNVTGSRLLEVLNEFQADSLTAVDKRLVEIRNEFASGGNSHQATTNNNNTAAGGTATNMFAYKGRFYAVPESFQFPKVNLRQAIRFWLLGQSVSGNGNQRVKPFRKLTANDLPTKELKTALNLQWKPIFSFLDDAANFPTGGSVPVDEEQLNAAYDRCIAHLKSTVSYCFANKKDPESSWKIATWSVRVARSSIEKNGTASDKEKLAPAGARNKARKGGKRNRQDIDNPLYLHRQQKRRAAITAAGADSSTRAGGQANRPTTARGAATRGRSTGGSARGRSTTGGSSFLDAFQLPQNTNRMQARIADRDREVTRQVGQEMQAENRQRQAQQARERALRGAAVAGDGTVLHTHRHTGRQAPNTGDNSTASRASHADSLLQLAQGAGAGAAMGTLTTAGLCTVSGCSWPQLKPDHPCHRCRKPVHNLCAQGNNLLSADNELDMFCSLACKQQAEG
jgi:hypothetical protein